VDTDSAGRVTGHEVTINANPPFSDRERMLLLARVNLPNDVAGGPEADTCVIWRSATLRALLGSEYAKATTTTGSNTARMEASSSPQC
jgi:hypothetical protein